MNKHCHETGSISALSFPLSQKNSYFYGPIQKNTKERAMPEPSLRGWKVFCFPLLKRGINA